jgi:hypothetical protein
MLFSSVFDLPGWGHVIVALVLTHITIVSVTVYCGFNPMSRTSLPYFAYSLLM